MVETLLAQREAVPKVEHKHERNARHIVTVPVHAELYNGNLSRLLHSLESQGKKHVAPINCIFLINDLQKDSQMVIDENILTKQALSLVQQKNLDGLRQMQASLSNPSLLDPFINLAQQDNIGITVIEQHNLESVHFGKLRETLLRASLAMIANSDHQKKDDYVIHTADADAVFSPNYFNTLHTLYKDRKVEAVFTAYDLHPGAIDSIGSDGTLITTKIKQERLMELDSQRFGWNFAQAIMPTKDKKELGLHYPQISFTASSITDTMLHRLGEFRTNSDYEISNMLARKRNVVFTTDAFVSSSSREYLTYQIPISGPVIPLNPLWNNSSSEFMRTVERQQEANEIINLYESAIESMHKLQNIDVSGILTYFEKSIFFEHTINKLLTPDLNLALTHVLSQMPQIDSFSNRIQVDSYWNQFSLLLEQTNIGDKKASLIKATGLTQDLRLFLNRFTSDLLYSPPFDECKKLIQKFLLNQFIVDLREDSQAPSYDFDGSIALVLLPHVFRAIVPGNNQELRFDKSLLSKAMESFITNFLVTQAQHAFEELMTNRKRSVGLQEQVKNNLLEQIKSHKDKKRFYLLYRLKEKKQELKKHNVNEFLRHLLKGTLMTKEYRKLRTFYQYT